MKIIQLDKTMDNLVANIGDGNTYFLMLKKSKTAAGTDNHVFRSKRLISVPFVELEKCLNDPEYALVKIEDEES